MSVNASSIHPSYRVLVDNPETGSFRLFDIDFLFLYKDIDASMLKEVTEAEVEIYFNNSKDAVYKDGRIQVPVKRELTPDDFIKENSETFIRNKVEDYRSRIQRAIDQKAQSLGFSDGNSLILYSGYENEFKHLAVAFGIWEAGIWTKANGLKDALVEALMKSESVSTLQFPRVEDIVPPFEYTPGVTPPLVVTLRQFKLALLEANLLDAVEEYIGRSDIPRELKINWQHASEVHRSEIDGLNLAELFKLSSSDVDSLFLSASRK